MDQNINKPELIQNPTPEKLFEKTNRVNSFFQKKIIIALASALVIILMIVTVFLFFSKKDKEDEKLTYQKIDAEFLEGNYAKSAELAKTAFEKDQKNINVLTAVITSIAAEGNKNGTEAEAFKKAQPYVDKANELNIEDRNLYLALGYLYETAGYYTEALSYYQKALELDPNFAVTYFHVGHVYEFLQNQNLAFQNYDKAYELDEKNPLILMGQARKSAVQKNLNQAFEFYKKITELPDSGSQNKAEALTNMAIIKRGQVLYMQEALGYAKQATELAPEFSPALGEYGYLLSINGNPKDGVIYIDKAISSNPRITLNYYNMGSVLRTAGQYKEADSYYMQALEKIKTDNTILSTAVKDMLASQILYDIAKTRWLLGDRRTETVIPILEAAIKTNRELETTLRRDVEKQKIFSEISSDQRFISLMQ